MMPVEKCKHPNQLEFMRGVDVDVSQRKTRRPQLERGKACYSLLIQYRGYFNRVGCQVHRNHFKGCLTFLHTMPQKNKIQSEALGPKSYKLFDSPRLKEQYWKTLEGSFITVLYYVYISKIIWWFHKANAMEQVLLKTGKES